MTKFKDIIFEENVAIHCPEKWMANNLLEYADSREYKWITGNPYLGSNNWNVYKNKQCYYLHDGCHCNYEYYKENNYEILHYNDVVIKDETSFDYTLLIKGRKAEIGSELWRETYSFGNKDWRLDKISRLQIKGTTPTVYFETVGDNMGISEYGIDIEDEKEFIERYYFWEKPIIYQLPDTEGNLSEVNIGQDVYLTEVCTNKTKKCKISKLYNNYIFFNDTLFVLNCTGDGYINFGGVSRLYYKTTTNKPHRDFSDCPHWEENPIAKYWGVDEDGHSLWFIDKPKIVTYGFDDGDADMVDAGYRADLLNTDGIVEDWEYSLVKRPEVE